MLTTEQNIAHISPDHRIQSLEEHAVKVASLCRQFASKTGVPQADQIGFALGLLHDFGKSSEGFQTYIIQSGLKGKPATKSPHSLYGAEVGYRYSSSAIIGKILAYCISGHHRGLYDEDLMAKKMGLEAHKISQDTQRLLDAYPEMATEFKKATEGLMLTRMSWEDIQLLVRMLFSCLVDADSLDTEAFCNPMQYTERIDSTIQINIELWQCLKLLLQKKTETFSQTSAINQTRARFLSQCIEHGQKASKGIYSLSLPTGAGKTLSSMAWALECAIKHQASRIIIVIPFTSIITQTASELKKVFGEHMVFEHHSEVSDPSEKAKYESKNAVLKALAENWDAPIIVTTNVQFFESLFSNKRARCRKLHNICNAVVIFDEVQMFPTKFLHPMVRSIESLTRMFGTQILLCTATQPIFNEKVSNSTFYTLKQKAEEVIPFAPETFSIFNRVEYNIDSSETDIESLAQRLAQHPSVLCIVNTRKDALQLAQALKQISTDKEGVLIHLSRMMCSVHLKETIQKVKVRLAKGLPTRVISTQLIEAGVDLDFPIVYRASAGLDSIIQAGGRCNREGKLSTKGQVYIFRLPKSYTPTELLRSQQAMELATYDTEGKSIDHPDIIYSYFSHLYGAKINCDTNNISDLLWDQSKCCKIKLNFEEASNKFKLIDNGYIDLYVPYTPNPEYSKLDGEALIADLASRGAMTTEEFRRLQQFKVGLREKDFLELYTQGIIKAIYIWGESNPPIYVLASKHNYSEDFGILLRNFFIEEPLIFL
ncbi:Superfamily II helicase [Porphyromonas cangingivalis]|uniref:CRISPR-associated helicase Cas3' n=1 Tax=Porphyromonas cangingivalis TaxID=36874 RepID=UPI000D86C46D|nr:CRISPR-associated helicase Cas3' [Porphyromonas cangingivalis]SPY35367.1 Superfamily II helicase [Porphyromonas cangingivalis]